MPALRASASDIVSTEGSAARPNAAANPISERAFRREIISDLMIALMSNLPWLDEPSANAPNARVPTLFHINRGGPATISCAEGVRYSSPARQRGAPPSFHVSFGSKPEKLNAR